MSYLDNIIYYIIQFFINDKDFIFIKYSKGLIRIIVDIEPTLKTFQKPNSKICKFSNVFF